MAWKEYLQSRFFIVLLCVWKVNALPRACSIIILANSFCSRSSYWLTSQPERSSQPCYESVIFYADGSKSRRSRSSVRSWVPFIGNATGEPIAGIRMRLHWQDPRDNTALIYTGSTPAPSLIDASFIVTRLWDIGILYDSDGREGWVAHRRDSEHWQDSYIEAPHRPIAPHPSWPILEP